MVQGQHAGPAYKPHISGAHARNARARRFFSMQIDSFWGARSGNPSLAFGRRLARTGRAHRHAFTSAMKKQHVFPPFRARACDSRCKSIVSKPTGDTELSTRQMAQFVTPVAFRYFRVCTCTKSCSNDKIRCHSSEQAKTIKWRTVLVSNFERKEKRSNFQLPHRKSRSLRLVGCKALVLA